MSRVLIGLLAAVACLGLAGTAMADGITNAGGDLRTGWYPDEGSLTPQLVSGNAFGRLWSAPVDGQVYAQPLYTPSSAPNGTVIVATENDKVYGLDPATGQQQWMTDLGTPWNPADLDPDCKDIAPSVGTSSTPVIDTSTNTIYLTHKGYDPSHNAAWYMDALDLNTGHEKPGWPVQLTTGSGFADNEPVTFFPKSQNQRAGLLLMDGVVYAGFGSHCDDQPWQGWVFGVSTAGQVKARWVDDYSTAPGQGNGGGIWGGGTGLASDGSGSIWFATGNGDFPPAPASGGSASTQPSFGEAVVRLHVQPNGQLQAADFFIPSDAASLNSQDGDLGSGGVVGLPDAYFGAGTSNPHLAVAVGKEGTVYLLDRDNLGGFEQGPGQTDNVIQEIGPRGSVYGRPGVWPGDGGYVYVPTTQGETAGNAEPLDVYKYAVTGSSQPSLSLAGTAGAFNWGSGSPVITSDGTASGSALVWMIYASDRSGDDGTLQAYDAVPAGGQLNLRFSAPIGHATGYSIPGVGAGRLYVGTRDGKVLAFGRLPGHLQTPTAAIDFGAVQAGTTVSQTFAVSNTGPSPVTITSSQPPSGGGFTAATSLPQGATIAPGQTVTETVAFTPTGSGAATGAWQITGNDGSGPHVVQFTGTGTTASPPPSASVKTPKAPRLTAAVGTAAKLARTYITYKAMTAGVSRFVLQRATVGRRGAHGCVAVIARNRSKARCTRYVVVATFTHRDRVGTNRLRLGAYVALRKLLAGSYRLQSTLLDSAGARHTFYTQLRVLTPPRRHANRDVVFAPLDGLLGRLASLL